MGHLYGLNIPANLAKQNITNTSIQYYKLFAVHFAHAISIVKIFRCTENNTIRGEPKQAS